LVTQHPLPWHAVPVAQQAWPGPPQGASHKPVVVLHESGAVQTLPVQQSWLVPPHVEHRPVVVLHALPALHVLLVQHACPLAPQFTHVPAEHTCPPPGHAPPFATHVSLAMMQQPVPPPHTAPAQHT
jgi:hypothetical protein